MKKLFVLVTLFVGAAPGAFAFGPPIGCFGDVPQQTPSLPPLCEADGVTYEGYWAVTKLGCYIAHCGPAPSAAEGE